MQKWKCLRESVTFMNENKEFSCFGQLGSRSLVLPQHLILFPPLFLDAFCP